MLFLACDANLKPIMLFIKDGLFPLIQIGIPILLIILGTLDLGKAVVASKEDEIKNAQKMLIKRCIYAVVVFFVVTIVSLVFGLFGRSGADKEDNVNYESTWSDCWNLKFEGDTPAKVDNPDKPKGSK